MGEVNLDQASEGMLHICGTVMPVNSKITFLWMECYICLGYFQNCHFIKKSWRRGREQSFLPRDHSMWDAHMGGWQILIWSKVVTFEIRGWRGMWVQDEPEGRAMTSKSLTGTGKVRKNVREGDQVHPHLPWSTHHEQMWNELAGPVVATAYIKCDKQGANI